MRGFTLLGAVAALLLGVVAFYGSQAVAGEYDDCYTPTTSCTGSCPLGTCMPIPTSLLPVECPTGNRDGFRNNGGSCGNCMLLGVMPSGDACGQPLSSEACF